MINLIEDWEDFCQGRIDYDESHFSKLFTLELDEKDLRKIFMYFSNPKQLLQRTACVRDAGNLSSGPYIHPIKENIKQKNELYNYLSLYISELYVICQYLEQYELCDIINSSKIFYCEDKTLFDISRFRDEQHIFLIEVIGDYVYDNLIDKRNIDYALLEAFYGLAGDFNLQWYLGAPIINSISKFEHYYNFWKAGGQFALTKDCILVRSFFDGRSSEVV